MVELTVLERGKTRILHLEPHMVNAVVDQLSAQGGVVLHKRVPRSRSWFIRPRTSPDHWVPWFMALSRTLRGGVPLDQALELLADAAPRPHEVRDIYRAVLAGKRFSEAASSESMGLPSIVTALLRAGEMAGDLSRGATLAHQSLATGAAFRRELTSKLAYPLVVVGAGAVALTVLMAKVFPALLGMWSNLGRAVPVRLLAFQWLGWIGVMILAALAGGLAWLMAGREGIQHLPGFRALSRHRSRSEAWAVLAMALGGGVSLLDAFRLLGDRWDAAKLRLAIQRGEKPDQVLEAWVDDQPGQRAVLLASLRTGDLAGGAQSVAEGYRELLDQSLQKLQRWLEPSILLLLGSILMGLAWGLFSVMGEMEHGLVR